MEHSGNVMERLHLIAESYSFKSHLLIRALRKKGRIRCFIRADYLVSYLIDSYTLKYNRNEYLTNTRKSERQKNERKLNQLWNKASHAFDDS